MAYTSTPETQTYETQRLSPVYNLHPDPGQNTITNGPGMRNLIPVKVGQELVAETRMCITSNDVSPNTNPCFCRGMHVWEKTSGTVYYFVVVSDTTASTSKVYTSTDGSTWAAVTTLTNYAKSSPVRFTEFIDSTNTKKLVLVDGIEGYVFTSNAAGTKIVDVDFPTPHVPFPVFIDGYLCLAKSGTGDIYNSDLDDPAIWTAGSFISSELYPDDIQALLKIDNYVVAVGTQGTEYFYDAGTPTGSPLARVDGAALPFGTPFPNSIATSKNTAVMLANSNDGQATLRIIEGTKSTQIPCPFLEVLHGQISSGSTSAAFLRGWFYRQNDDLLYTLNFNVEATQTSEGSISPTLTYSFNNQMWIELTYNSTNHTVFPVYYSVSTTSSNLLTYIAGHGNKSSSGTRSNVFFGTLGLNTLAGSVSSDIFQLTGGGASTTVGVTHEIRTEVQDFGSMHIKTQNRFGIDFNKWRTTSTTFNLSWNSLENTAYTNYTTAVSISTSNTIVFPFYTQLGAFRRRSFKISVTPDAPLQIKGFEVNINRNMR